MDRQLCNVITYSNTIQSSVNTRQITGKVNQYDLAHLNFMQYEKMKHLHILGSAGHDSLKQLNTEKLPAGCHVNTREGWALIIGATVDQIRNCVFAAKNLELLDIRFTDLQTLEVGEMAALTELHLSHNRSLHQVTGLQLKNLKTLDLHNTAYDHDIDLDKLPALNSLVISKTQIKKVNCTRRHRPLQVFNASESALESFQFFDQLTHLQHLDLSGCPRVNYIPESIRDMNKLDHLLLMNLQLEDIPDWIAEKNMTIGLAAGSQICLQGSSIKNVDMRVFEESTETILHWLTDRKKDSVHQLNELKIVFLGDGGAGKSHTIARLMRDGQLLKPEEFAGDSTPGICIEHKLWEDIDGREVTTHFWDFGGQEILHSMHRIFLTEQTLYVVLVDARNDTRDDQARYWLNNIRSVSTTSPVILVLNKIDQNPNASIDAAGLQSKYPNLKHVLSMSALKDEPEDFKNGIMKALRQEIAESDVLNHMWPSNWMKLKSRLQHLEKPYITREDYENICRDCSIDKGERRILDYFRNLGISFYWEDRRTNNYVILRPEWITNAVYTILFNKRDEVENGMITHHEIYRLLAPSEEEQATVKRVQTDEKYEWPDISYILNVVRRFHLSYRVSEDTEFFPMLCKRNSKSILRHHSSLEDTLEFHMEFQYLPQSVLHRLMVVRYSELDTHNIWLTGARFHQPSLGLSAVVSIDENKLKLYVRSSNSKLHSPNTYLSMLRNSVEDVCSDMKLELPRNFLVYKQDGKSEVFDYRRLIEMLDAGIEKDYSSMLGRLVEIKSILNQAAPAASGRQMKLIEELLCVCGDLQAQTSYHAFDEDGRNTYVRDGLRRSGYIVHDQTFAGSGRQNLRPGELDMEIRLLEGDRFPWTICEALRVSGCSKAVWNDHLFKLLLKYNTHGLNFLILLTYVDCTENTGFNSIYNRFEDHIRKHAPCGTSVLPESVEVLSDDPFSHYNFIKVVKCTYDIDGYRPVVYHMFVKMG